MWGWSRVREIREGAAVAGLDGVALGVHPGWCSPVGDRVGVERRAVDRRSRCPDAPAHLCRVHASMVGMWIGHVGAVGPGGSPRGRADVTCIMVARGDRCAATCSQPHVEASSQLPVVVRRGRGSCRSGDPTARPVRDSRKSDCHLYVDGAALGEVPVTQGCGDICGLEGPRCAAERSARTRPGLWIFPWGLV